MKKLVILLFIVVLVSLCSCKEKGLNDFRGQAIAMKSSSIGAGYFLYFKNKAELECIEVSYGEYKYYNIGDTINW